jgi:hypothetical protein
MKRTSLVLLLLLGGCASRSWTERTETTRPVGETSQRVEQRALTEEFYEARTGMESDGYQWVEDVNTDDEGEIEINLLPAALQCLYYGRDVTIELYSYTSNDIEYTRRVNADFAANVINEWSVQANLGAEVPLKRAQADLLDKLVNTTKSTDIKQQLQDIRRKVTIRFDWE